MAETKSFYSFMESGAGRIEYVFHVGGFPYGVSTHEDVATVLNANLTEKRKIFGHAQDADSAYFADDVPIFANLDSSSISQKTIKMHEKDGWLRGGGWSVKIYDKDLGHTWDHRNAAIRGLDGIQTVPNPRIDESIYWGFLQDNLEDDDATLTFSDESGGDLYDKVGALTGYDTTKVWIGHECIACAGTGLSGDNYTLSIVERGLYRTRPQTHYNDELTTQRIPITDAPLGGAAGRAGYVWALVLDPNDSTKLLSDPALIIHGRIKPNITTKNGITSLSGAPAWEWLETTVDTPAIPKIPTGKRSLAKYVFARHANSGTRRNSVVAAYQSPHLVIKEFDKDGASARINNIWLCDQGADVTYNTIYDLYDAINLELHRVGEGLGTVDNDAQSSGDEAVGLDNQRVHTYQKYAINNEGVLTQLTSTGSATEGYLSAITGPLAWLLQLGPVTDEYTDKAPAAREAILKGENWYDYAAYTTDGRVWGKAPTWLTAVDINGLLTTKYSRGLFDIEGQEFFESKGPEVSEKGYGVEFASPYIYQPSAASWTIAQATWPANKNYSGSYGPNDTEYIPPFNDRAEEFQFVDDYVWLSPDTDISIVEVKPNARYIVGYKADRQSETRPRLGYLTVDALSTATEYPRITITDLMRHFGDTETPFRTGQSLFFLPFAEKNNRDPWGFNPQFSDSSDSLSQMIRGLLGDSTSTVKISPRYQSDHIPDFIDTADFNPTIDWAQLERKTRPLVGGHYFATVVDQKTNLAKLLAEEIKFFGLNPTWEWSGSQDQFIMRFHEIGEMNATIAVSEGRSLNSTNTVPNPVRESHSSTWIFNEILAKCNWDGEEFRGNFSAKDTSGLAPIGSGDYVFKAEAKFSQIKNLTNIKKTALQNLQEHFQNDILNNMLLPMPTYNFRGSLQAALVAAVGKEILVTDSSAAQPYNHEPGLSNNICLLTSLAINWGAGTVKGNYRVGERAHWGYAPSMLVQADTGSVIGVDKVTIEPDLHEFSSADNRVDLSNFDCIVWNRSTNGYAANDCDCGDYEVLCIEWNTKDPDFFLAHCTDVDITAGTAVLTNDTNTIDTLWDEAKTWLVIFAPYNNANTTDCQRQWLYFADSADLKIDTDTGTDRTRRWK